MIFRQNYIALHAFSRIVDLMSAKSKENGAKKSKKKLAQNFRFSCFLVRPLYNTGDKIGSKGSSMF